MAAGHDDDNRRMDDVNNTAVGATAGTIVQAGAVHGSVYLGDVTLSTAAAARTRYREQVQRIAPMNLIGRERELAELVEFCGSSETAGTYWWWQAGAWSGKSALMSWFALHAPPRTTVLSFFVTSRWLGQGDRRAFIDNVLEQLVTLLSVELPPLLTESTAEAHLLGLLADAAEECHARGEQFVLLVDGLDEDRGVTIDPDSHSIAALLPPQPPAGMRIIVAGRPHPPIPADVPHHHPLRDPRIVHHLTPSPTAHAVRVEMERDLKRLLHGEPIEQDLLGLVTTAGGGLTAADLAELTNTSTWEIDDYLRTVTGRSFARRASHYRPGSAPDVYLLGHEELYVTACDVLGPTRLAECRRRLHAWAGHYLREHWPIHTPEYLLLGYYEMLAIGGNLPKMVAYSTDPARQECLFERSRTDAASIAEIVLAQKLILARNDPDLAAMARLAVHYEYLIDRNSYIPTSLPLVWALLGRSRHAQGLARSIDWPEHQFKALLAVADAAGEASKVDQAVWVDEAEQLARRICVRDGRGSALADFVIRLAGSGDLDRAEGLVGSIIEPGPQSRAMATLAVAIADTGDHKRAREMIGQAEQLAQAVTDLIQRTRALSTVAMKARTMGDADRAAILVNQAEETVRSFRHAGTRDSTLADLVTWIAESGDLDRAEGLACSIVEPESQSRAVAACAVAAADAGNGERARDLIARAEQLARTVADETDRNKALAHVAARTAALVAPDHATALAGTIAAPEHQSDALCAIAATLIVAGRHDEAIELINRAERVACTCSTSYLRSVALRDLTDTAVELGDLARAESLALAITEPFEQSRAYTTVAVKAAKAGDVDRAARLANRAQSVARKITRPDQRSWELGRLAQTIAAAGNRRQATELIDQAERLARNAPLPILRDQALAGLAWVMAESGDRKRAEALARTIADPGQQSRAWLAVLAAGAGDLAQIELLVRSIDNTDERNYMLTELAITVARAGDHNHAATLADAVTDPQKRSRALAQFAAIAADSGDHHRIAELVSQAKDLANDIPDREARDLRLAELAITVARAGDHNHAATLARTITDPGTRGHALAQFAVVAAGSGDHQRMTKLVGHAKDLVDTVPDPYHRSWALASVVEAIAATGDLDRAEHLANTLTPPFRRGDALTHLALRPNQRHQQRLLAEVLTLQHWSHLISTFAKVQPDLLNVIASELTIIEKRTSPS